MFPNFPIHASLKQVVGIDLSPFSEQIAKEFPHLRKQKVTARWNRLWFGWNQSPEQATTFYYWAEDFIRGNRKDHANPLRWDSVILNLLGSKQYNPSLPNVYKWDKVAQRIAGDLIAFIDDLRAIGYNLEEAWRIARWIASKLEFLGIQDAPRKRRLDNGPWAGGLFDTTKGKITKTVTKEKWNKGKKYIRELKEELTIDPKKKLEYKRLERIRGFLCHLAMVYDILFPFLKGFLLTLSQHLPRRDKEGWKINDLQWIGHLEGKVEQGKMTRKEAELMLAGPSGGNAEPKKSSPSL